MFYFSRIFTFFGGVFLKLHEAFTVRLYPSLKVTFITGAQSISCLFCIQAEIILQGTMYLSPDVGSGAPPGLAWGPSTRIQDRMSLVAVLVAYLGGKQATEVHLFAAAAELPSSPVRHW